MTIKNRQLSNKAWLICAVFMWAPLSAYGEDAVQKSSPLTYSVGLHYSEGKYSRQASSSLTYVPIGMKFKTEHYQLKVLLPWLLLHGVGNESVTASSLDDSGKERGMGDVSLQAKGFMPYQHWLASWVDLGIKIKLPTADEAKGLGTGKTDFTLFVDTLTPYKSSVLFATLGYRIRGDSTATDYENGAIYELGFMQKWQSNQPGILFSHRDSAFAGRDSIQEVLLFNKTRFQHQRSFSYYIGAGLTDNSSDWMCGVTLEFP